MNDDARISDHDASKILELLESPKNTPRYFENKKKKTHALRYTLQIKV